MFHLYAFHRLAMTVIWSCMTCWNSLHKKQKQLYEQLVVEMCMWYLWSFSSCLHVFFFTIFRCSFVAVLLCFVCSWYAVCVQFICGLCAVVKTAYKLHVIWASVLGQTRLKFQVDLRWFGTIWGKLFAIGPWKQNENCVFLKKSVFSKKRMANLEKVGNSFFHP